MRGEFSETTNDLLSFSPLTLYRSGRVQLINVWRPLRAPARDMPLAFCDSRTVDKEKDLVYSRLLYPPPGQPGHQVEGETFNVKHNEKHDWYYVPDMGPQEGELRF